jgi:non-specific serine/threonine protein kinase
MPAPQTPAVTPNQFTSFGELLRFLRRRAGFTQRELSIAVGYSESQISRLEQNQRAPDEATLAARFVPALQVEKEPEWAARLLELGAASHAEGKPDEPGAVADAPSSPHNLPLQLTSFVGREKEMAEIKRLFLGRDDPVGRLLFLGRDDPVGRLPADYPPAGFPLMTGDVPPERLYSRLITLTGPGGTGKTRLALQAAADLLKSFPDGVWFVELAPLADPALIPQTVATVFGLKEEAGRPLLATLTHHLRDKKALLVVDNCEHLVQACAQFAEALLLACPKLYLLASSREMLGVPGERPFYVPSLSTPDVRTLPPVGAPVGLVSALTHYEAVRLFVERAVAVAPSFTLTQANAPAVAQVCQRLDGIPLAIELAAARLRMLPVEQIAARLDDSFRLLTGGSRTALPRHQTLQALIDWSYDLLTQAEQVLLRRLAVFAGSWTLEAAEAVGADDGVVANDVFDLLGRLIDKSLVLAEEQGGAARYRLLETIRQYALAKLAASGEADAVRRRHAEYFLALTEAGAPILAIQRRPAWFDQMELEHDNLRAALAWSQLAPGGAELGLRLTNVLSTFWYYHGYWSEEQGWLESALAHPEAANYPYGQAQALLNLGQVLGIQGGYVDGQAHVTRSLKFFQELGDRPNSAWALHWLGWVARERGDATTARARLEECVALFRDIGDDSLICNSTNTLAEAMMMQGEIVLAKALLEENLALARKVGDVDTIGWALNHLGHVAQLQGEYEQAIRLHEESLPLFRKVGLRNEGTIWAHQSLGETALAQGDARRATTHFTEALVSCRDLGDRTGTAWCLAGLAGVAAVNEVPERAAWLWGVSEALRQSIGAREAPASRATRERLMAQAREQLGEAAFAAAWAEGQAASTEQAIAQALETKISG